MKYLIRQLILSSLIIATRAHGVQLETFETRAETLISNGLYYSIDQNDSAIDYSSSTVYFNSITNVAGSSVGSILPIPITNAHASAHSQTGSDPNRSDSKIFASTSASITRTSSLIISNSNPNAGPVTLIADVTWNYLETSDSPKSDLATSGATRFYFRNNLMLNLPLLQSESNSRTFSFLSVLPNQEIQYRIFSFASAYGPAIFSHATTNTSIQFHLSPETSAEYSLTLSPHVSPVPEPSRWMLLGIGLMIFLSTTANRKRLRLYRKRTDS